MKLVYKRSSAATALAEPEESHVSDNADYQEPSPAPAGALHRVIPAGPAETTGPEAYVPQRGSYGMRVRGGMPAGTAGRVVPSSHSPLRRCGSFFCTTRVFS